MEEYKSSTRIIYLSENTRKKFRFVDQCYLFQKWLQVYIYFNVFLDEERKCVLKSQDKYLY